MRPPEDRRAREPGLDLETLTRRRETVLTVLALLFVLAAGGLTAYYVFRVPPVSDSTVVVGAQDAVRESMGPGLAIQFSGRAETQIERLASQKYKVSAQFVAVTAAGEARSYSYVCVLERLPDSRWGPAQLTINPR